MRWVPDKIYCDFKRYPQSKQKGARSLHFFFLHVNFSEDLYFKLIRHISRIACITLSLSMQKIACKVFQIKINTLQGEPYSSWSLIRNAWNIIIFQILTPFVAGITNTMCISDLIGQVLLGFGGLLFSPILCNYHAGLKISRYSSFFTILLSLTNPVSCNRVLYCCPTSGSQTQRDPRVAWDSK